MKKEVYALVLYINLHVFRSVLNTSPLSTTLRVVGSKPTWENTLSWVWKFFVSVTCMCVKSPRDTGYNHNARVVFIKKQKKNEHVYLYNICNDADELIEYWKLTTLFDSLDRFKFQMGQHWSDTKIVDLSLKCFCVRLHMIIPNAGVVYKNNLWKCCCFDIRSNIHTRRIRFISCL